MVIPRYCFKTLILTGTASLEMCRLRRPFMNLWIAIDGRLQELIDKNAADSRLVLRVGRAPDVVRIRSKNDHSENHVS